MADQTVSDFMFAQLAEVRKLTSEYRDAQQRLSDCEAQLRNAAVTAARAEVPKAMIAATIGISRPTLYAWLDTGGFQGDTR